MDQFLFLFTRASKLMRGAADEAMSRHGVRVGQNVILEMLWIRDGQTPGELASLLGIATPTVVRSAERMQAAGLLTRRRDAADGRLVRLWLTPAGRDLQPIIELERAQLAERALDDLNRDERDLLIRALTQIVLAFGGDPEPPDPKRPQHQP
jgi:MarR family transcriptional regulator, organic hydroperoxide resistance regulator